MTAIAISGSGGLLDHLKGEYGNLDDSSNGIDVDTDVPRLLQITIQHPKAVDGATDTTADDVIFYAVDAYKVVAAHFIPHAALSAPGATNYGTIAITDGTTTFASLAVQAALTDNTPVALTLGSDLDLAAAGSLHFTIAKAGGGSILPAGKIQVTLQHD